MAKFADWSEVYEPLVLPVGGKSYTLPAVAAVAARSLLDAIDGVEGAEPVTDSQFRELMLGDAYSRMVEDGVPAAAIKRAELTALAELRGGRSLAEMMWSTGGEPAAVKAYIDRNAPVDSEAKSKG